MKNPRLVFAFIILLSLFSFFINLPGHIKILSFDKNIKYNPNYFVQKYNIGRELAFRQGLDLKGGVSITFKAEVEKLPSAEREKALESARAVIERQINQFGAQLPLLHSQAPSPVLQM